MKTCMLLFLFAGFSFSAESKEDVVAITLAIMGKTDQIQELGQYYSAEKVDIFQQTLTEYGPISYFLCQKNHDSLVFDTVACFINYQNMPSGLVWEFYYFFDGTKWIGTNLGIIQVIPEGVCVRNIQFKNQLGRGISYEEGLCKRTRA